VTITDNNRATFERFLLKMRYTLAHRDHRRGVFDAATLQSKQERINPFPIEECAIFFSFNSRIEIMCIINKWDPVSLTEEIDSREVERRV
jgi:hypothetical protein